MARSTSTSKTKKTSGSKKKPGTTRTPSRTRKTTSQTTLSRTAGTAKTSTPRKKPTTPAPSPEPLSTERKVDIAGIVLLVIGLLTLLSLMTSLSSGLTQAWADFLHRWIGWGAYALPLVLLLIGAG